MRTADLAPVSARIATTCIRAHETAPEDSETARVMRVAVAAHVASCAVLAHCGANGDATAGRAVLSALASLVAILRGGEAVAAVAAGLDRDSAQEIRNHYLAAARVVLDGEPWCGDLGGLAAAVVHIRTCLSPWEIVQDTVNAAIEEDASTWRTSVENLLETLRADLDAAGWTVPKVPGLVWPTSPARA